MNSLLLSLAKKLSLSFLYLSYNSFSSSKVALSTISYLSVPPPTYILRLSLSFDINVI